METAVTWLLYALAASVGVGILLTIAIVIGFLIAAFLD